MIINDTNKPEVQLRAISELHSIEMSIFSLWKQLRDLEFLNKEKSLFINIESVMPEDRDRIFPIAICRREGGEEHYACYKCLQAFCRPDAENDYDCIKCPRCKIFEHPERY